MQTATPMLMSIPALAAVLRLCLEDWVRDEVVVEEDVGVADVVRDGEAVGFEVASVEGEDVVDVVVITCVLLAKSTGLIEIETLYLLWGRWWRMLRR
jgi:hypothetical protein